MKTHKIRMALGAAALLWVPAALSAQEADNRWLAFLGCWEADAATPGTPMLCVMPHVGGTGVDMVTVQNSREATREWVSANGTMQESNREGCRGWERARFSEDGRRLYLDSEHVCDGGGRQTTSGMLAMIAPDEWVDVRTVIVGEEKVTGVIRYKLAPADDADAAGFGNIAADRAMAVRTARINSAATLAIDDVIDATRFVDAEVTRTWIAERGDPFRLDGSRLVRMADAGVPDDVIDVVVAVSYPEVFQLGEGARATEIDPDVGVAGDRRSPMYGGFWNPMIGGYGGYGRYGRYGYDRYGYGYGYNDPYGYGYGYPGYYSPTIIVVQSATESGGRVVNGRGYTKGPSNTTAPRPSGSTTSSTPSTSSSPAPSSTSTPSSSGTSTGRTAQPRPPQ